MNYYTAPSALRPDSLLLVDIKNKLIYTGRFVCGVEMSDHFIAYVLRNTESRWELVKDEEELAFIAIKYGFILK